MGRGRGALVGSSHLFTVRAGINSLPSSFPPDGKQSWAPVESTSCIPRPRDVIHGNNRHILFLTRPAGGLDVASRGEMKMHMRTRHTRCAPGLGNMGPANKARLRDTQAILGQQLHFSPMRGNWLNPNPSELTKRGGRAKMCEAQDVQQPNHEVGLTGGSGCVVSCCAWVVRRWPACLLAGRCWPR